MRRSAKPEMTHTASTNAEISPVTAKPGLAINSASAAATLTPRSTRVSLRLRRASRRRARSIAISAGAGPGSEPLARDARAVLIA
jgi:hypothetical protein